MIRLGLSAVIAIVVLLASLAGLHVAGYRAGTATTVPGVDAGQFQVAFSMLASGAAGMAAYLAPAMLAAVGAWMKAHPRPVPQPSDLAKLTEEFHSLATNVLNIQEMTKDTNERVKNWMPNPKAQP